MSGVRIVEVAADDDGIRLDRWFRRHYPALSHGTVEKMIRTGQVRLDGARAKASARIAAGQSIRLPPPILAAPRSDGPRAAGLSAAEAQQVADMILLEDDHVIVLAKPAGLASQGGSRTARHVDGLLQGYAASGDWRPRLVHRLDKDTSGVLVVAKTASAAAHLTRAFREKTCRKCYWALVLGHPRHDQGMIEQPVQKGRLPSEPETASGEARDAVTLYRVLDAAAGQVSWLELEPVTGRTHQLRIHCALIGHPILGDRKYGGGDDPAAAGLGGGLHLHARALRFPHPQRGPVVVTAPLPARLRDDWAFLGFDPDREASFFEEPGRGR